MLAEGTRGVRSLKRPARLATLFFALAVAVLGAATPSSASASATASAAMASHAPAASVASATTTPAVGVTLTLADSGDLGAGAPLKGLVTVVNPTAIDTPAGVATVSVDPTPFTSRSALAAWFAGTGKTTITSTVVAKAPMGAVTSQLTGSADITAAASALPFAKAGVYAVAVQVTSGATVIGTARTAVAWNASAAATVPVSIAVRMTVPAGNSGLLTATQLAEYTGPNGILTTELADVQGTNVAIGIDPRVLASIRILGTSTPQSARDWLDSLTHLTNESFPLAWADADLTAPIHAGSTAVVGVKSLQYAINASLFPTGSTPTPAPTDGTDTQTVPTPASLVAWNYTMPRLEWPAASSVEPSDLDKLNDAGISSIIVASANIDDPDAHGLAGASARSGSTAMAISDDVLSGYLRQGVQATTRTATVGPLTELTTTLALIGLESKTPDTVLLTLAPNWAATNFSHTIGSLYARSWVTGAALSSVFSQSPNTVTLDKDAESETRLDLVGQMLAAEAAVVRFSPIAKVPAAITSSYRLQLLALLSNEWLDTPSAWATATRVFVTQADKVTSSVQLPRSSPIVAGSDQIELPISITNGLDQDVTVRLTVRPTTAQVSIAANDQVQTLVIPANSQRRVQIPIVAVSNGKAGLLVTLTSVTGTPVGSPRLLRINVQAGWETLGTLIFAALIFALFLFGLIRNIRKRRRANSAEMESETGAHADAEPAAESDETRDHV